MITSESPIDERYRLRLFDYYLKDSRSALSAHSADPLPVRNIRRSTVRQHCFGIALRTLGCSLVPGRNLPSVVQ